MENKGEYWEANYNNNNNLVNELTRGKELARQLQMHLSNVTSSSHDQTCEYLVQKILVSFEKGISLLNWPNPAPAAAAGDHLIPPLQHGGSSGSAVQMSESPPSLAGSPRSDQDSDRDQDLQRDASKKRKSLPRWTKQVRVNPGMGLEGPLDDGFSWRKYGQKDILGAKYPRGYYRCTHRNVQGCLATKQVQRSDNDPNIFEITYRGRHTCNQPPSNTSSPTIDQQITYENQEHPIPNTNTTIELSHHQLNMNNMINVQLDQQNTQLEHDMLSSLRSGLRVITEGLDDNNNFQFPSSSSATSHHRVKAEVLNDSRFLTNPNSSMIMGNPTNFAATEYSPTTTSFHLSPSASGTSYFPVQSPQGGIEDHFGMRQNFNNPNSESEINTNSATNNSPNVGTNLDFPFGHVDDQFDPNFTFGHQGFY